MKKETSPLYVVIVFLLALLYSTSWYSMELDISGYSIFDISEIIGWLIFLFLVVYFKYVLRNTKLIKVIFIFFTIGLFLLFESLFVKNLSLSTSIGAFRRFFYIPVFGLFIGKMLFLYSSQINKNTLNESVKIFPFIVVLLILFNAIISFREVRDDMLVVRSDAFVIFFYLLIIFHARYIYGEKLSLKTSLIQLVLFILIVLTASRGVILSVLVFSIVFFYFYVKGLNRKLKFAILFLTIVALFFLAMVTIPAVEEQVNKGMGQVIDFMEGIKGTSGVKSNDIELRYYRYQSAFLSGLENPVLGNGLGQKEEFYIGGNYMKYEDKTAHNILLSIWYRMGIIGIFAFGFFIYNISKNLHYVPAKLTFFAAYFYSLFDVMMASSYTAILIIYIIAGFYFGYNPNPHVVKKRSL